MSDMDAYLDGVMDEAERRTFEQRLDQDAELRAAAALQRDIDDVLRRRFAAPDGERVRQRIESANGRSVRTAARPRRAAARRTWGLAAAAVVVLAAGVAWWTWPRTPSVTGPEPWRTLAQVYQDDLAAGWKPEYVCTDPDHFAIIHFRRLGQGAMLADMSPPGIQLLGISYARSMSDRTTYLIARIEGKPVAAYLDRLEHDEGATLPPDSGLNLFRRELEPLVLYEVTPLDRPHLLDLYQLREVTEEMIEESGY
ncbi:MAG: hypothetical protein V3T70_02850 [Phycisphaerae bacterium]